MRFAIPFITVLLAVAAAPAAADDVRLKNGDRYSGEVVRLAGGTLTFKTAHGELGIPWVDVVALNIDSPLLTQTTTMTSPQRVRVSTAADGQLSLEPGTVVAVATIVALSRPDPPVIVSGGANAGFLATGGNTDVNTLRLDGEAVIRAALNRYTVNGAINRAQDAARETARNASVSFRYDRFVSDRLFMSGSGIFTNDRFRDLDLRSAVGVGAGYQVFDTARLRLSAEGGVGYVHENFESAIDDSYGALREAAKLDVFVVGERVIVFHLHDGYYGVTGDDNAFIKAQNGVRFGLVGGLVTTAQLDVEYDRSPAPGRKNVDRAFALTFGYRF